MILRQTAGACWLLFLAGCASGTVDRAIARDGGFDLPGDGAIDPELADFADEPVADDVLGEADVALASGAWCSRVRSCLLGTDFPIDSSDHYIGPAGCVIGDPAVPTSIANCIAYRGGVRCLASTCAVQPAAGTCGRLPGCLSSGGGLSCFSVHACSTPESRTPIATVSSAQGSYRLKRSGWTGLGVYRDGVVGRSVGVQLYAGDLVRVDAGNRLRIRCSDGVEWYVPVDGVFYAVREFCR